MQRECKIAMKSEEFVRRGLPQVKGLGLSETFRKHQGAIPGCESPPEGLRDIGEDVKEF
ncbi:UNVERIFIED_CONTAM: hypothetical protein Sradi_0466400 [Sesamum radiatum]|uniref:Uncharacterized protein n=1 Tax=Sesamum radiatum TaxID=300843 RepID=A0AAW2W8J5_SESRA